ncbi:Platelet factor 4 [Bienertia sinuspersici]
MLDVFKARPHWPEKDIIETIKRLTRYYNDVMAELEELNADVALAFKAYNPKCFCRAFMDT